MNDQNERQAARRKNPPLHRLTSSDHVREETIEAILSTGLDDVETLRAAFEAEADDEYSALYDAMLAGEGLDEAEATEVRAISAANEREAERFDARGYVESRLRSYLEDTVTVIPKATNEIRKDELDRALMIQALVALKVPQLELILAGLGETPGNRQVKDLARQVGRSYGWNPDKIARLVLDNQQSDEIATDDGYSTRVFTLQEPISVSEIAPFFRLYARRALDVGRIRWFFFAEPTSAPETETLRLQGQLRTFRPHPVELGDKHAKLDPQRKEYDVELVVNDGSTVLLVLQARNASVARAAVSAFEFVAKARRRAYVKFAESGARASARSLHPQTEFLLSIVRGGLPTSTFGTRNALHARFRTRDDEPSAVGLDDNEPASIHAWSGEGRQLLNTPSASKLMWSEGRALTHLTFAAALREGSDRQVGRVDTRLILESDHVVVETALAGGPEDAVRAAHLATCESVSHAVVNGVPDSVRTELAQLIAANETGDGRGPSLLDPSDLSAPESTTKGD